MCGRDHVGSGVLKLYTVSIIIRSYNLGYWIWHISVGFWFGLMKSIKLILNSLSVTVLGADFGEIVFLYRKEM